MAEADVATVADPEFNFAEDDDDFMDESGLLDLPEQEQVTIGPYANRSSGQNFASILIVIFEWCNDA